MKKKLSSMDDQWVYYKIYANPRVSNIVLKESIASFVSVFIEKGIFEKWFFVRYADPDPHLRLRFYTTNAKQIERIQSALEAALKPYMKKLYIWKIEKAYYQREIGRYGQENMELVESIFCLQSHFAIVLQTREMGQKQLIIYLSKLIHKVLIHMDWSLEDRGVFVQKQRDYFMSELEIGKEQKKKIGKEYRKLGPELERFITYTKSKTKGRDITFKKIVHNMNDLMLKLNLPKSEKERTTVIGSILHMQVNKCFVYHQRTIEYLIYEYLNRAYRSYTSLKKKKL